ncbi:MULTISPECIES: cytochrome o ubiquinol oxidase subunit I [Pseudoalteromonas]|uniref:Cytochrome bo(3) ubiquinol oxidase subunit 1 n=1 Tax=Pseudoalteromonas gelatinilytica TaxID=1703256 RepID=A0A3A3EMT4_9GAMM|nr:MULTISPECIES: cytochrome o ubiquinol oxidase subunit I [Pseudoalteromonas]RJF34731.1 cytochrome o ubiquinol oxidase subunit I [Pseudoalteromonas profundi]TMO23259.1 cytochrome o ubiquinol oxidase subunit I [Pseudoalteromonas sp. S4492]
MSLLGKLTLDAIPYHEPIIMVTMAVVAVLGLLVAGLVTKYKKWGVIWHDWITSIDHKRLGVMYIILALIMLFRGFADAIMMRLQLAMATGGASGYLPPEHYDQIFTAHGVIMIIFMAMPFMIGLMNIILPLQIGARDVAFPFLNNLSFWLTAGGAILINISLFFGEFAKTGWVAYPPLSELSFSPGVGVDYYIWALQISGLGTLLTAVNFLATVFKMRAPGMTLMKMPIFTWTCTWANILVAASFPILTAVLAMLTLDRYLDFHFFTNAAGGNAMMYINLFWAWGHPEVYILILPAFGIFSEVISTFAGKRLFGYKSMVYASGAISILGFIVWLHHFFTMGSSANVNAFFGVMTMVIAVPTGVKLFNWLFTMYRGRLRITVPVLWTLGFMVTFTIGGMTGVLLAIPGADYVLHNSLFLIAHFHNTIIGGAVFGYLAGFAYWFPKAMGFKLDESWGRKSFWCWLIGFFVAFMPLYVLGFLGMTRRLNHTNNPDWNIWLYIAAGGAVIILFGILFQVVQLVVSFKNREQLDDTTGDPWNGHTLEWASASPPQYYNFAKIPHIDDIDAWTDMKEKGLAYKQEASYSPIHMPKNTPAGVLMSAGITTFCFAMIWHIWWLAAFGLLGAIVVFIKRCYTSDVDYYVQPDEIVELETAHNTAATKEVNA